MDVSAVVVARRRGPVDPLTPVGGVPMVVRAVRCVLAALSVPAVPEGAAPAAALSTAAPSTAVLSATERTDRVVVLAPAAWHGALTRACAGLPVEVRETLAGRRHPPGAAQPSWAHAGQRAGTPGGDGPVSIPVLLVHDAARPLAPPALAAAVLAELAATGCAAVVPVLPLTDTVKLVDAQGLVTATPDRAGLRVLQSPVAVRAELVGPGADPLDAVVELAAAGSVRSVVGDPLAFPVHSAWDLELAGLLAAEEAR
jgi:2-C-methyl-D-erythritol 4-phosphate cytidylyltransferase